MYPELHLGPLTIQTFGLCFALAFVAAGALVWKRFGELGKPVDWGYEMGFAALLGTFSLRPSGYLALAAQAVMIAAITAWASRRTLFATLDEIE